MPVVHNDFCPSNDHEKGTTKVDSLMYYKQTTKLNFEIVNARIQSVMSRLDIMRGKSNIGQCAIVQLVPLSVPDHPPTLKCIFAA